jgi:hypothetical protein
MNARPATLWFLITSFAVACSGDPESPPPDDTTDPAGEPDASGQPDGSSRYVCDYKTPPRCGPRGCVAMCVTCFYDRCRANGGSCEACKADMEVCKWWCAQPPY